MKICMVSIAYYPNELGGSPVAVRILAEALKKKGHEVFIITADSFKNFNSLKLKIRTVNGIKVYYFCPLATNTLSGYIGKILNFGKILPFLTSFWNPHTYYVIKKILKRENPDVVHIHEPLYYLSLSVFSAVRSLNIPYISTLHGVSLLFPLNNLPYLDKIAGVYPPFGGYTFYDKISSIYARINRIIVGDVECVIFLSKAVMNEYSKQGFFKQSKKIISPNIIEIDNSELEKTDKEGKETFDIMYAGRLTKNKGLRTLIKAFKKIQRKNVRLHIFGDGPDASLFKSLAVGDERIIFYGVLPNKELQKFYKLADVSVVPSECFENFSIVIIESFRARVPVIGSNVGGNPELIKEGYNGFLFEPGNVEQLKNILEKVINNKEKLKEIGENAFEWVKRLDSKERVKEIEEIYKKAIKLGQRKRK